MGEIAGGAVCCLGQPAGRDIGGLRDGRRRTAPPVRGGMAEPSRVELGPSPGALLSRGTRAREDPGALRPSGCGLSDRPGDYEWSVPLERETLRSVMSAVGASEFDLMGSSLGVPIAIDWAASSPETVNRLILYGGWARGADIATRQVREHVPPHRRERVSGCASAVGSVGVSPPRAASRVGAGAACRPLARGPCHPAARRHRDRRRATR